MSRLRILTRSRMLWRRWWERAAPPSLTAWPSIATATRGPRPLPRCTTCLSSLSAAQPDRDAWMSWPRWLERATPPRRRCGRLDDRGPQKPPTTPLATPRKLARPDGLRGGLRRSENRVARKADASSRTRRCRASARMAQACRRSRRGSLRRDATDPPRGRHAEDLAEDRDRLVAGQDEERPAPGLRVLVPLDLAASHHG